MDKLPDIAELDTTDFRESVLSLQGVMSEMEQIDCPVTHHFAPGVYCREIFMPAGAVVVGKIHKHAHMNIISKGRVVVSTEFGKAEFVAPYSFVSEPGTKRAVCVLEDCIWTTIHPTDETDLQKIEDHVIAKTFDEYDEFASLKLGYEDMKGYIQ